MPKEIDQRAQRHDPASKHTQDPNARPDDQTKQPGSIPSHARPDEAEPGDAASSKYNSRDDGHSDAADDRPLQHIKKQGHENL